MKKIICIVLLICACAIAHAQINLLRNGSFEQHDSCPNNFDQIRWAKYWDAIDTNYVWGDSACLSLADQYSEYVNVCGTGFGAVPINIGFHRYPRTGNGMVQSAMFFDHGYTVPGFGFVNYFQGRMINHLVAGQSYCVTFFVVQEAASQYSINKIGAYLDDGTIDTTSTPAVEQTQYTPQILETSVISDTTNWTKIQGSFIANGTEKFITIGVFFDTAHVTHINNMTVASNIGYYLTDDVSVIASNAVAFAGNDTTIMHGDTATLGPEINGDGMPCWWYKLGVTAPIDSGGTIYVHPDSSTSYVVMMDLCGHITYDTVKVWVYPDTPSRVGIEQLGVKNVQLYPNPATAKLTIEHAASSEVVFYDVVGRTILYAAIISDKQNIDISQLPRGMYIVQVTGLNGEVLNKQVFKE